ncbi:sensor histidine kinase [Aquibacillus sediminis]|uniref:sensor histidine kinase n=1 Tax=Aquibacillus sediminis TaxID=2574734 RepID=UPI001109B2E7|nr:sensor histidine kinase [Aquibacillus sediminis]
MRNWFHIFPNQTGISIYIWIIFCILPFYFIFRSSSSLEVVYGIVMTILFFASYRLSFLSKGWPVYVWVTVDICINIVMTLLYGYVYFSLFLAFFIGNIQHKAGFITLYVVHLVTTVGAITIGFFIKTTMFLNQIPFIIICILGVILLPFSMYNRIKREKLEGQLKDANEKISQLLVIEERQRIARDLHDTLGQKLSLIGLKSDLANKLIDTKPNAVKNELNDIRQTARTALKEVREMVADMKGIRLEDELVHIQQILDVAQIESDFIGAPKDIKTPLFVEHIVSMCLKEAVTNIVKHSNATHCRIVLKQCPDELVIQVEDNGIGIGQDKEFSGGHGITGMRERLEFVNGSLDIGASNGTTLTIRVPNVIQQAT